MYKDRELIYLLKENDDDAKDYAFIKYGFIVDIIINKYRRGFLATKMDFEEVKQELLVAFSNALYNYEEDRKASLQTFISLVVERRAQNLLRGGNTIKNQKRNESYSLDYEYGDNNTPLLDIIADNSFDPSELVESKDAVKHLKKDIEKLLSSFEYEVYSLMLNHFTYIDISKILNKEPKQIDNTIQRIRGKIRNMLENI